MFRSLNNQNNNLTIFNDDDINFQNVLNNSFQESVNNSHDSNVDINLMMANISIVDNFFNKYSRILNSKECNICYETKQTTKCFKCEIYYCKLCLIRIITQFAKCSSCNCSIDSQSLKDYITNIDNMNDISSLENELENTRLHESNNYINNNKNNNNNINTFTNTNRNTNRNTNTNANYNDSSSFYSSSDSDDNLNINKFSIEKKNEIIQNIKNNNIYTNQKDFKSINRTKNKLNNNLPKHKFKGKYDFELNQLIFKSNSKKHNDIIIDYKIFNTECQRNIYVLLNELLKNENNYKNKWNILSNEVNKLTIEMKNSLICSKQRNKNLIECIHKYL
jgi:hypothetical protein